MAVETTLPDSEKIRIASDFLQHAPPGEFNEVFNSVRMLVTNDNLLKEGCGPAIAQYNMKQFVPLKLPGTEKQTLITPFNDLGNGRFFDDNAKRSFKYDHLRKEASDVQPYHGDGGVTEKWRSSLQTELDSYMENHFSKTGTGCVFSTKNGLVLCIESHLFQNKNYCNGRWRSEWIVPVGDGKSGNQELTGKVRVQVHYFEDGNVQLFSEKDFQLKISISSDIEKTTKEIINAISTEEAKYQHAVHENYACMSDVTFKALRRQLPVIRSKMDWNKVQSYRIGHEMKTQ